MKGLLIIVGCVIFSLAVTFGIGALCALVGAMVGSELIGQIVFMIIAMTIIGLFLTKWGFV